MSLFSSIGDRLKGIGERLVGGVKGFATGGVLGAVSGILGGGSSSDAAAKAAKKAQMRETAKPLVPTTQSPTMRTQQRATYDTGGLGMSQNIAAYDEGLQGMNGGDGPFPGAFAPAPMAGTPTTDIVVLIAGQGAMAVAADTPPALAPQMLQGVGQMFKAAAAKVVAHIMQQIQAVLGSIGGAVLPVIAKVAKLGKQVLEWCKAALPWAGIAAAVAAIGLGIYFGWSYVKSWGMAIWRKFFGRKKRRRRGISARDLQTCYRVNRALKKAYGRLPRRAASRR